MRLDLTRRGPAFASAQAGPARDGFADPVRQSQCCFRTLLAAMAHPGRIVSLEPLPATPAPLASASYALCLTLLDLYTPLWLDDSAARPGVREALRFHCGAPIVDRPDLARFALIADGDALPRLDAFALGTDERPEDSATLLIQLAALRPGPGLRLSGPGIAAEAHLAVAGLPGRFVDEWRDNRALFPRGVDVLLVCGSRLAALPRTVRLEG